MALTSEELEAAADYAERYPRGHGDAFFVTEENTPLRLAASAARAIRALEPGCGCAAVGVALRRKPPTQIGDMDLLNAYVELVKTVELPNIIRSCEAQRARNYNAWLDSRPKGLARILRQHARRLRRKASPPKEN